jgi:hypothetical protein
VLVPLGAEPALKASISATRTIPIVFVANNYDPIALGYVSSLAKPGGNVTGIFLRQTELAEKQVELLHEAVPERKRMAVLWDDISASQFAAAEQRAKLLGLHVRSLKMENPPYDFDAAFRMMVDDGSQMVLALTSPVLCLAEREAHGTCDPKSPALDVHLQGLHTVWWFDVVRCGQYCDVSPERGLRRQDIAGLQASRPSGGVADQVRVRRQPQDRQGDWRRVADLNPAARQRRDRIALSVAVASRCLEGRPAPAHP